MPTHMTAQATNVERQTITTDFVDWGAFERGVIMPRALDRLMKQGLFTRRTRLI
jgi:hypothetical protein